MPLNRKVAIITGAGSGIGRSTTHALLREGFSVVLAGRRLEKLEETVATSGENSSETLIVPTDISNPQSVSALFAKTKEVFGRLDLLFNNAAINITGVLLEDLSPEQWEKLWRINVSGPFYCTQEAFKMMKNQDPMGGRIINNGSISAQRPRPDSAQYTISKHAINGLTQSTALDGRKYNIACGQIDIGNALTEMAARMKKGVLQADGSITVEPTIDVKHIADAVVYMANLPLNANVLSMTVLASQMPFVGRG